MTVASLPTRIEWLTADTRLHRERVAILFSAMPCAQLAEALEQLDQVAVLLGEARRRAEALQSQTPAV